MQRITPSTGHLNQPRYDVYEIAPISSTHLVYRRRQVGQNEYRYPSDRHID